MTDQHPINLSKDQIDKAIEGLYKNYGEFCSICNELARWGADQELEACVALLNAEQYFGSAELLEVERRPNIKAPKATAVKEALDALEGLEDAATRGLDFKLDFNASIIRRALELMEES